MIVNPIRCCRRDRRVSSEAELAVGKALSCDDALSVPRKKAGRFRLPPQDGSDLGFLRFAASPRAIAARVGLLDAGSEARDVVTGPALASGAVG
ncbi:hypothetical protein ABZ208_34025, partial [Streptomyces sp. NPDC006208]|uniref:hypothetical protein n=1 Tax=Streptomyces sp. NPDC006208 TaxID=3156734 RepID=UPI0033A3CC79